MRFPERLANWRDQVVVVDCSGPFVVLGTLREATTEYLELADADMHDLRDTATNRELYLVKAARHGVEPNRATVVVRLAEVVGVSLLVDVAIE